MDLRSKGQGLSFNVIVIAALALVVLIVMILIFTKGAGNQVSNLENCPGKGGKCDSANNCNGIQLDTPDCKKSNQICCVKIGGR